MSNAKLERIHVSELYVDPIVQRALDPHRARKIADVFDPNSIGALIVNHRSDGKYFIIDGQHRHAAAVIAGYDGKLPCVTYDDLPQSEEARLFLTLNDSRLVQAIDKFRMRVLANEPVASEIHEILERNGWRPSTSTNEGCFAAVMGLEKVYNGAGVLTDGKSRPDLADQVVSTITGAWGHSPSGTHLAIVVGLGQLLARFGPVVDFDKLITEMSKSRPVDLVAKARGIKDGQGGTVPAAMARVLVGLHNKSRRINMLPDWSWTR